MGYSKEVQDWRREFVAKCGRAALPESFALALMRHSATSQRLAEAICNGPAWTSDPRMDGKTYSARMDRWQARMDAADKACDLRIERLCKRHGVAVELSGDPRGCVVKVRLRGVAGDSAGGDGLTCVPVPGF